MSSAVTDSIVEYRQLSPEARRIRDIHSTKVFEARFAGLAAGWKTPPRVPYFLKEFGFTPDIYVCNQTPRLGAMSVDIRRLWKPTIQGDMNHLPLRDRAIRCAFFDPPYDVPYKRAWREVGRISRERCAILHVRDVGPPSTEWVRVKSILLLCGNDSVVRCLGMFVRLDLLLRRPVEVSA